jgi:NADH-quinone oxidoreductase subunit N
VNLHEIVSQLILDTRGDVSGGWWEFSPTSSIGVFLPEIALCATIVLILLVRVFSWGRWIDVFWPVLAGSILALFLAAVHAPAVAQRMEFFTGLLVYDSFSIYMRSLLLLAVVLVVVLTKLTGILNHEEAPDIYTLVLGATLGMCLMISANHLLMVFLAVEMASVPSYALVALMKQRARASEAALKYAVYGAATSGVMLYGISLIAGLVNSAHLPTIARVLAERMPDMPGDEAMILTLAALMIMVGVAFKLAAVPFHFWCPDAFEGATAEVNAFLSVASKTAALGLLIRVVIGIGVVVPPGLSAGHVAQANRSPVVIDQHLAAGLSPATGPRERVSPSLDFDLAEITRGGDLAPLQGLLGKLVALLAMLTCTLGNLAAYGQTNIKRLLAYSTIAHAGYMMMAIPPVMALAGQHPGLAERAVAGLGVYLAVYLFMNLGAFSIVAFLRNVMHSEQVDDYAGLVRHCPGVVICLSLMLFSLLGIPPLAGFVGKFAVFASLVEGYKATGQGYLLLLFLVGGANTALSLVYYLRVVKVMTLDPDAETRGLVPLPLVSLPGFFIVALTLPTVILFFAWEYLNQYALRAAQQLLG